MTTTAREEILQRIRTALADVPDTAAEVDTPIPWTYGQSTGIDDVIDRFEDRVVDYRAAFERCAPDQLAERVVAALQGYEASSVVLPDGLLGQFADAVAAAGIEVRRDDPPLTRPELDATSAVVTASAVSAAESGTIMLDHGPDQGRRALSLVPDVHVCIVRADQVVTDVPEAVARIAASVRAERPITWISGGSATSDIELSRVEGVHGPRTLHVILVES